MGVSLGKQKKFCMIVAIVGVVMLVVGGIGTAYFYSVASAKSKEYDGHMEEIDEEYAGSISGAIDDFIYYNDVVYSVNASETKELPIDLTKWEGGHLNVWIEDKSETTNATMNVTLKSYPSETILWSDILGNYYDPEHGYITGNWLVGTTDIDLTKMPSQDTYCKLILKNEEWFESKNVKVYVTRWLTDEEIQEIRDKYNYLTEEQTKATDNGGMCLIFGIIVGTAIMLLGIVGLLVTWTQIRKQKHTSTPPPAVPLQPQAQVNKCPHCGADVQPFWKACPACGEKLEG